MVAKRNSPIHILLCLALVASGLLVVVAGIALLVADQPAGPYGMGRHSVFRSAGGGMLLFGTLLLTAGLAAYVLAPTLRGGGEASRHYGSHRTVVASFLLAAAAGNGLAGVYFAESGEPRGLAAFLLTALSLDGALFAVTYLRIVRPGLITWKGMGLTVEHFRRWFGLGLAGGVAVFAASTLSAILLEALGVRQTQLQAFHWLEAMRLPGFLVVLAAASVVAPVAEEVFFRGYVFKAYLQEKGAPTAYLMGSLLFAAAHLEPSAFLPIFFIGLLLSFMYHRTGSIVPGIMAHGLNNALAFAAFYYAPHLGLG